ncbi:DUF4105 domain-containing protein [Bacteriovorax sp. PP10]|uniref:DUF4105 domain-containing protein n=1 Tax=Bacteriovorax antarcticus TaxID=3088717 RepID=A0ABU5VXX2_9BACT|nr:DUF4105 domain-containing protein [Bacteriovorax sp. PP10]MEA9357164.1 DUF4105 domain-containing protein [Bacteriovorax sp. PP10]
MDFDYKYWEKLLHFKKGESLADGEKFFLSPNGKKNPEAELRATISAFFDPNMKVGWFNYHPQCVFRARYEFFKESGLLKDAPVIACPELDEWKAGLNAESITLIFSSSYPNNPSSLFGHTLLRLNQKDKKNDLLDYAVAFSAVPEKDDPGLIFAFKGFFGGYKGLFEVTKYYTKVNEYNNGESRDLIEYNLSMTPAELDRTINHLWELYQTTYFDYYFADENCSAVLADLIAVGYKDDVRVNAHARWYYLPGEMVKHFSTLDGRIKSTNYRPSLKKQVAKMWEHLTPAEISEVKDIVDMDELPEGITNTKVLDAVIGYLDFTHYRIKHSLSEGQQKMLRKALIKRATLPKAEMVKEIYDQSNMPEFSHNPQKFSFFTRVENHNTLAGFEIKQGYHDLMSNDRGFDAFSQFDFLNASLIYDFKNKKVDYDKITVVDLISLHEYRFYDPQLSWRAKVTNERIYDLDCKLCHKVNGNAYGGLSFRSPKTVFSVMLGVFGEVSSNLKKGFRAGPGSEISFYAQLGEMYKIGLYNEIRFDATKKIADDYYNQFGLRHSFFTDNKRDYRFESSVVSQFGSFKKNTVIHQVTYGQFF